VPELDSVLISDSEIRRVLAWERNWFRRASRLGVSSSGEGREAVTTAGPVSRVLEAQGTIMKLSDRKTRLTFITNSTARYRGKEREIVIEVFPEHAAVRLLGTRTRYEASWRAIFDLAAEIYARREKERRKAERAQRRRSL